MMPRDVTALYVPFTTAQNVRENVCAKEDVARGARLIGSKDGTLIVVYRDTSTVLFLTALDLPKFVIGRQPMTEERRDFSTRAAIVQRVIEGVVQNPSVMLTVEMLQQWLNVPHDAARRILSRLDSSGLVTEVQRGVWARGTLGTGPSWY